MFAMSGLYFDLICGDFENFQEKLKSGGTKGTNGVNEKYSDGTTILHHIVDHGEMEFLNEVLKYKPNLNARDNEGNTPLHHSVRYGKFDCMMVLLKSGAKVEVKNDDGYTPLHETIYLIDGSRYAQKLIEKGANINAGCIYGWTPLHLAYHRTNGGMIDFLINNGANTEATNSDGYKPDYYYLPEDLSDPFYDLYEMYESY